MLSGHFLHAGYIVFTAERVELLTFLLQIIFSEHIDEVFDTPTVVFHCFSLSSCFKPVIHFFIVMNSSWGFIVAVMA